jgi:YggT family protein
LPCSVLVLIHQLITIYVVIMLVYAVVSWIPSIRGRWTSYIAMLVDPVLQPVRRIIPPLGGLDLSFLVVIILLQVVDSSLRGIACTY